MTMVRKGYQSYSPRPVSRVLEVELQKMDSLLSPAFLLLIALHFVIVAQGFLITSPTDRHIIVGRDDHKVASMGMSSLSTTTLMALFGEQAKVNQNNTYISGASVSNSR